MRTHFIVAMTKIDKRDFFSKTKSNDNLQPMIIAKLYLYHFSVFETLHPPNNFLVFQAKIEAYCRIKSYDRGVAPGFKGDVTRGRFAKTVFSATQLFNVGTFETMLQQCCNAVLR